MGSEMCIRDRKEALGRKVRVVPGRGKGTLEIEFYSNEDLKDLANKLGE